MKLFEYDINNLRSPATFGCYHCTINSSFFRNNSNVCRRLLQSNILLLVDRVRLVAARLVLMLMIRLVPMILVQFVRILLLNFLAYLSFLVILEHLLLSLHFLGVYAYERISFRYPCCAFLNDEELAGLHRYHCLELKLKEPKALYNLLYAKKLLGYLAYQDYV